MKKFIVFFTVLVFFIPLLSLAASKPVILRFAGPWPPLDPVTVQMQGLADKFNKIAKDRYKIEIHPGESLVKILDSLDAVRKGAVEMIGWPIGVFASVDPRFAAAEIPFLVNNVEADAALQVALLSEYGKFMEQKFNCKPLVSFTCLALDLCGTKPVKKLSDWKGLLTQSVSPQSAKFIEYLGGSSVPLPFPEAYQALQKGTVNATMQSSSMMIMFKLYEVAKYVTRGYLIPASIVFAINYETFKKMPKDLQEALVKAGLEQQKEANDFFIKMDKENSKTLREKGMDVYHLPKEEREAWKKKVEPYVKELFSKMPSDFAEKVKKAADEANKKFPYKE